MKKYISYDGVEHEIELHETEQEALSRLTHLVQSGLEDGEWLEGTEDCLVAEITHYVKPKQIDAPEEYQRDGIMHFAEMEINSIEAERDRLLAELEKVTAERDELINNRMRIIAKFRDREKYTYDSDWERAVNDAINRLQVNS